jgi:hypothetical protein
MTYIADLTDMTLPTGDQKQELWVGWLGNEVEEPGDTAAGVLACDPLHHGAPVQAPTGCQASAGRMMECRIGAFHQAPDSHRVADLECGHGQHVRHDPPWQGAGVGADGGVATPQAAILLGCNQADCHDGFRPLVKTGPIAPAPVT